ncbi:MAG: glycosyltransferase family 39 protein [bacterium]
MLKITMPLLFKKCRDFIGKNHVALSLALIIILGAFFRFRGLYSQGGIYNGDDESFLGVARSFKNSFGFLYDFIVNGFNKDALRIEAQQFFSGSFRSYTSARPGYILLITIPTLIFGVKDYIPTFLNASLSLASIYLVYKIGKEMIGKTVVGLLSALVLSISGYSIFFSRTGSAQTASSFFLILGMLFYFYSLRVDENAVSAKFYLKLAAITFGFLFTTHYNVHIFLAIIFCFDIVYFFRKKLIKERLTTVFWYFIPFIVFFEMISILEVWLFNHWHFQSKYFTYFGEIIYSIKSVPSFYEAYSNNAPILKYLIFLKTFDSIIIVFLFLLAPFLFFYKKLWRNHKYFLLFILTYLPFVFYSLIKLKTEYNFVVFLPLIALLSGVVTYELIGYIKNEYWKKIALIATVVLILFFGLKTAYIFSGFKNPYNQAAQFLKTQGEIKSMCGTRNGTENVKFYLNDYSINSKMSTEDCPMAQYVMLDWALAYFPVNRKQWEDFTKNNKPIMSYDHPYFTYLCEHLYWEIGDGNCRELSSLRIYKNY